MHDYEVRNNSQTIAYNNLLLRGNSSYAKYLHDYEVRNNSQTIAYNNLLLRGNSSYAKYLHDYEVRNNSQTIAYNNLLLRGNSSYAKYLHDYEIRNNSQAIAYNDMLIRVNSNAFNDAVKVYGSTETYSSDTTVSNLVYYRDGITISGLNTLTLESPIPVSGQINFGGSGTITLNDDLYLAEGVTIASNDGYIDGNDHAVVMGGDLTIPSSKTFYITGDTIIDGRGNSLIVNGILNVAAGKTLTLRNMSLDLVKSADFSINSSGTVALQNVTVNLEDDWVFSSGSLSISDDVVFKGRGYKFEYSSSGTMTINVGSMLYMDIGTTFEYDGVTASSRTKLSMTDATSVLYFKNSTFSAPASGSAGGVQLTKGTIVFEDKVVVNNKNGSAANNSQSYSIEFGDGGTNDANIYVLAGARVEVTGCIYYNE